MAVGKNTTFNALCANGSTVLIYSGPPAADKSTWHLAIPTVPQVGSNITISLTLMDSYRNPAFAATNVSVDSDGPVSGSVTVPGANFTKLAEGSFALNLTLLARELLSLTLHIADNADVDSASIDVKSISPGSINFTASASVSRLAGRSMWTQ